MSTTGDNGTATSQEAWHRAFVKEHKQWCDDFVLELRMRDVPGGVIGDHLAEVETHCTEAGRSPLESFGDPTQYARELAEQTTSPRVSGPWPVAVLAAAQVLSLIVGTGAAASWADGEQLSYNAVQLAGVGLVVGVLLSLPLLLGLLVRRPWSVGLPVFLLGILGGVVAGGGGRLNQSAVLHLPASAVAIGLFVVVLVITWAEYRELSRDAGSDLVTSPLSPTAEPPERPTSRHWVFLLPTLLVPVAYVVFAAIPWLAS